MRACLCAHAHELNNRCTLSTQTFIDSGGSLRAFIDGYIALRKRFHIIREKAEVLAVEPPRGK
jgi:hypothetical protein